jgi:hypothetical protein
MSETTRVQCDYCGGWDEPKTDHNAHADKRVDIHVALRETAVRPALDFKICLFCIRDVLDKTLGMKLGEGT